jgi:predicted P-loop ATPase
VYLGVKPTVYVSTVGAKWLISGIARIYRPGCKCDCCLILEGLQGIGKSTALRTLGDPWFTDSMPDLSNKDSALQLRGIWIVELAELDALARSEVAHVKSYMSRSTDRFRPPYGRRAIDVPRESIFCGSVNHQAYLLDETGGRRFWPVCCGIIDIPALRREKDQLWAEARERFIGDETWWIDDPGTEAAAAEEQRKRYDDDPWDTLIASWADMRETVSIEEILRECLCKDKAMWNQSDKNRISRCLISQGWERFYAAPRHARKWKYRRPLSSSL